jgi:hypothetical protein
MTSKQRRLPMTTTTMMMTRMLMMIWKTMADDDERQPNSLHFQWLALWQSVVHCHTMKQLPSQLQS